MDELLELVGLDPASPTAARTSSPGPAAAGRAGAGPGPGPAVVLLDEPFSSLDAGLREQRPARPSPRPWPRGRHRVLVTHDQAEALSFADQVAVMRDGPARPGRRRRPRSTATRPTAEAAAFLGDAVLLPGVARDGVVGCPLGDLAVAPAPAAAGAAGAAGAAAPTGGDVIVLLRPEQLRIRRPEPPLPDAVVVAATYFGHDALVELRLRDGGHTVVARVPGTDVPPSGSVVGVAVTGAARTYVGKV